MEKRAVWMSLAMLSAVTTLLVSCASFTSQPFEPVYAGKDLGNPLDLGKLRTSIRQALITFDWRGISESVGAIDAEFVKDSGAVRAEIRIVLSTSGYRIEYVDSKGLNVNLSKKTIHRNYMRWIRNLDKEIAADYYKLMA